MANLVWAELKIEDIVEEEVSRVHRASSVGSGRKASSGEIREAFEPNANSEDVMLENALIRPGLGDSDSGFNEL